MANAIDGTQSQTRTAEEVNIDIVKQMANLVASSLGPRGRDKMLVDNTGGATFTNDGATILRETKFEHPTTKIIVGLAKTIESEAYDGTTSGILLAGELCRQAEMLMKEGVHVAQIEDGFEIGKKAALEHLITLGLKDFTLEQIAGTAMTGKQAGTAKEHLTKMCINAATKTKPSEVNMVIRPGSSITDSYDLEDGIIIDKQKMNHGMVEHIVDAHIALFDCDLIIPKFTEGVNVNFQTGADADAYSQKRKSDILSIGEHLKDMGVSVVVGGRDIDPVLSEYFARNNMIAIRRCNASLLELIAEATGGMIVSSVGDLAKEDLGHCGEIYEHSLPSWDKPVLHIGKLHENQQRHSVLCTGPSQESADEVARALDDAIGVTWLAHTSSHVVTGGGAPQVSMALYVQQVANTIEGLEQLAVEAYSKALEIIPLTLAKNCGHNPRLSVINLKASHGQGNTDAFLNVANGGVVTGNPYEVIEPMGVIEVGLKAATTAAIQILRIDNIIQARDPNQFGA
jgi:archaeal chaperonin